MQDRTFAHLRNLNGRFGQSEWQESTLNGLTMFSWALAAYLLQTCRSWGSDDYMLFGLRGHSRIHKIPYMLAEQVTQIVACSASEA